MIKVSIEVRSGVSRFRVGVRAESISDALSLVGGSHPGRTCRVMFPKGAVGLYVHEPEAQAGRAEQPQEMAA